MPIINSKTLARLAAIQVLYSAITTESEDISNEISKVDELYSSGILKEEYGSEDLKLKINKAFFKEIVENVSQNSAEIDKIISDHLSKEWDIAKIHPSLKSIIRCAISEILFKKDIPTKVIISEYTDLTSSLLKESEVGFVNSILDTIANKLRDNETQNHKN